MKVWISWIMTVWASMIGINHLNGGEIPIRLVEVTEESGIGFRHSDGSESGQRHISESVASGLATFDYNGDGLVDLLFLNGWDSKASVSKDGSSLLGRSALYRNEGGWRFTDVSASSGLMSRRHHLGVCVGDVNEDGLPDLYFSNFGSDILYRNLGDGTFLDVTAQSGLASLPAFGAGALFLDMDADGDLDLFVAQYCDFTFEKHQLRYINGFPAYTGPMTYGPVADRLYENQGDGTFKDVSASSGIASRKGTGMGVVATDFDNDGDQDIVVGNDAMANFVWRNDGGGHFTEVGLLSGLAFDANGVGLGTMGVDCADFNHDGVMDFFMTSYEKQWVSLYEGEPGGLFTDVTHLRQAGQGSFKEVNWGCGMIDFDNDGYRDLFVACGHLQDNVHLWDEQSAYPSRNLLLRNNRKGRFDMMSPAGVPGLSALHSSRGAAFDDLDNDGDMDVVILNARAQPTLLRNDSPNQHDWIGFDLRTSRGRHAVGARVSFQSGSLLHVDEVRSGRGYQSHYGSRLHFGLGNAPVPKSIRIRWPSGEVEERWDCRTGQYNRIQQGR